ncbi:MAG: glutamine synthetase type III, partial [Clostridia bacterium]|nr:glutamine synthetase type III [Clostridia bacterium]
LENYSKVVNIEALTMIDMANKQILPAVTTYVKELAKTALATKELGFEATAQIATAKKLTKLSADAAKSLEKLAAKVHDAEAVTDIAQKAMFYRSDVIPVMNALRKTADEMEVNTADKYWPFPTYGAILFSVKD